MAEFMAVLGAFGNILQTIEGARRLCADIREFRELSQTIEETAHQIQTAEIVIRKYKVSIETRHVEKYDVQTLQTQLDDVERTITQLRGKLMKLDPGHAGQSGIKNVKRVVAVFLKEEHSNMKLLMARISQSMTSLGLYFQAVGYEILDGFNDALQGIKNQVECLNSGPKKLRRTSTTPSGYTVVPGPCSLLPYERDENFVGREDILDEIEKKFKTHKSVVLCGLGGIGKSQIALEYCHSFIDKHPNGSVFWMIANSLESIDQGYQDIACALDLPVPNDSDIDASKVVFDWLREETRRPWLIVLDNADTLDVFSKANMTQVKSRLLGHLPHNLVGATMFTTRDKTVGSLLTRPGGLIQIPNMRLPESKTLLKNCLDPETFDEDDENIPVLLSELDHLPLAIVQAGAYIRQQSLEISDYLEIFKESASSQEKLLSHEGATNNRDASLGDSIMVTWKLSFDEVVKRNKRAADILTMLAVMGAGLPFPKDLLKDDKESKKEFIDAIAILQAFSLIQPAKVGSIFTVQLHRLVRLAIRKWLADAESLEERQTQALDLLVERYPATRRNFWALCQLLHPHALSIFDSTASLESCLGQRSVLLCKVGNYEGTQGRYEQSCNRLREAVAVFEKLEGASDPKTLALYKDLGFHLCQHGNFGDAEKYLRSALEGYRDTVGTEHLDYVEVINYMGALYKEMGDFEKAKEHFERTYSTHHNSYGPTHPETIRSRDSLAVALYSLERFDEAALHHQANIDNVEDDEELKIEIEENLAEAFLRLDRLDEAEDLRRAILKKREELFPPRHYETIFAKNSLALTLQEKKQFSEAERLDRQAFSEFSDTVGPYHLFTLQVARDLGSILFDAGNFVESEKFYRHALKGHREIHKLTMTHPEVLENMGNVAAALRGQKKFVQAEEYGKHVFEMLHKTKGIDDKDTMFRIDALSITLVQQGKYDEAIGLFDEVIEKSPVEEGIASPGIEMCLGKREEIWAKLREAEAYS